VLGSNADDTFEIFLLDGKNGMTQITTTTGGINEEPAVSNSGAQIVFTSDRNLVPAGNSDANREIFLFDKKKGFTQITNTTGCGSAGVTLTQSGTRIAFVSSCDLVAGSNADANTELFFYDVNVLTQITQTTGGTGALLPKLNGGGTRIAFFSDRDLVSTGTIDLNLELFLFDTKKGFVQITTSTGGSQQIAAAPAFAGNGKRIAFEFNGELTPGSNADGRGEIYVADQD